MLKRFLKDRGQTSIEYVLLLVVSLGIGVAFKKKMEEFILTNPNSIVSKNLNAFQSRFESDSTGRYRKFSIR